MKRKKPEMTFERSASDDIGSLTCLSLRRSREHVLLSFDGKNFIEYFAEDILPLIENGAGEYEFLEDPEEMAELENRLAFEMVDLVSEMIDDMLDEYPHLRYVIIDGEEEYPPEDFSEEMEEYDVLIRLLMEEIMEQMKDLARTGAIHLFVERERWMALPLCPKCMTENDLDFSEDGYVTCPSCGVLLEGDFVCVQSSWHHLRKVLLESPEPLGCITVL